MNAINPGGSRTATFAIIATALILAGVPTALAIGAADPTTSRPVTIVDPETVEQRDLQRPPQLQAAPGPEVMAVVSPLPPEFAPKTEVDPTNPPKMDTAVPVPASDTRALSASIDTAPVDNSDTEVAFRPRFDGQYERAGQRYEVVVEEPSALAKKQQLQLGTSTTMRKSGKVYVNEPSQGVVAWRKDSIVAVFGGESSEDRLAFLDSLEIRQATLLGPEKSGPRQLSWPQRTGNDYEPAIRPPSRSSSEPVRAVR